MFDGLLIVMGGLLGSGHCIGMCGGFALTLGAHAPSWRANLVRQMLFAAGRVSTYVFAGSVVGFGSWRLGQDFAGLMNVQGILSIAAGLLLLVEGVVALGWLPRPLRHTGCPGAGGFASLLRARAASTIFVAGLVNGLLPCGLVYAYLALAGSMGHLWGGAAVMGLFGLGTVPAMVLTGLGGGLLSVTRRRQLFRAAAWCLIVSGVLALGRGAAVMQAGPTGAGRCPLCIER